jgi:ATP-binding protein involved in chromosome partitioning|tara:strand:- start:873 stop:1565 length:693 start_codon:yes stop_codon:yes gene_type:complete
MNIKKIIAIASAKGGVGKSTITALSALSLSNDFNIGILDADIYGPNQHIIFNIDNLKPEIVQKDSKKYLKPLVSNNIKIASMGSILDDDKAAVWRGPMLSGAIKQLIHSTDWGNLDLLIVDMPPGTGDAYLTVAGELDLDGVILVTTPNRLAINDTIKSIHTFNKLNVPILGFIENMNFPSIATEDIFLDKNIERITQIPFDENIYNMSITNTQNLSDEIKFFLTNIINA